jgi:hypothetical protein
LGFSLPAVYAQQSMGSMGMDKQGGAASAAPAAGVEFGSLWRQAIGLSSLQAEQLGRMAATLRGASAKLAENWVRLQELRQREQTAAEEARASIGKRIELDEAERDLIVAGAETELRDYLMEEQVHLVMAAAFHGVSRAHSEKGHPMTMGMGTGAQMAPMQGMEEMGMRLAAAALELNSRFQAVSLDELLRELEPSRQ